MGNLLTSEADADIRHILYSHPRIGWSSFVLLLSEFFVLLLNGRNAREDELPSIATIKITLLNWTVTTSTMLVN